MKPTKLTKQSLTVQNSAFEVLSYYLLELFIVVFIVCLLLGLFAIPTFLSYVEKAKMTETFSLMNSAKLKIAEYYSFHGYFPNYIEGIKTKGKYTSNLSIDNGAMTVTLSSSNQDINGLLLTIRPTFVNQEITKVMNYVCGYAQMPSNFIVKGENKTNVPPEYLISKCR